MIKQSIASKDAEIAALKFKLSNNNRDLPDIDINELLAIFDEPNHKMGQNESYAQPPPAKQAKVEPPSKQSPAPVNIVGIYI